MTTDTELKEFTIDEIFGDINLESARMLYENYWEDPSQFDKSLARLIQERIVDDAIDMINHRTGQKCDPRYMSFLLEWSITGSDFAHRMKVDPTELSIDSKKRFIQLEYLVLEPQNITQDMDKLIWDHFTDEMYEERFNISMEDFGE